MELLKYDEIKDNKDLTAEYEQIKNFNIDDIANLTIDILNKHSSVRKLNNANRVCELVMFMLKEKKLIRDEVQQTFVDLLISSSMLYNIINVTDKNWNDIFKIRNIIKANAVNYPAIPDQAIETICDTIEGQLGESMPIKGSRPNPNTPGELFAMSVAIINRYNK